MFNWPALIGLFCWPAFAYLCSQNRRLVSPRFVGTGILLQVLMALFFLRLPAVAQLLMPINQAIGMVMSSSSEAAEYLFGYLSGGTAPFEVSRPDANFIIAFRVLPLIVVVSALSSALFYLGVLPFVIRIFSVLLTRAFGLSGALSFGAASTVFLGTIEAPLMVKPYLAKMSRADLFALLSCSMATVSGAVMVLYSSVLAKVVDEPVQHLLIASILSVPAALTLARLMIPAEAAQQESVVVETPKSEAEGFFDALVQGAQEGMNMVMSVVALLLTLFACVFLCNHILEWLGAGWTLQQLLGFGLRPVMWLTGIPWAECGYAGELMGMKVVLNEFVAYLDLSKHADVLSSGSRQIMVYNLCGFANFGSLGIILGGLGSLLPERRQEISKLLLLSLVSGNLAVLMTGSVVALVSGFSS
jgi:concentrative nucleoside transporter, CNT family